MSNTLFSSRPPVTVLMAVYNGARFLNEAIESIRNQTFTDFEFLIIDDGSSDATPEILARHAADRRIRILRQENQGLTESLNRGIREASRLREKASREPAPLENRRFAQDRRRVVHAI